MSVICYSEESKMYDPSATEKKNKKNPGRSFILLSPFTLMCRM